MGRCEESVTQWCAEQQQPQAQQQQAAAAAAAPPSEATPAKATPCCKPAAADTADVICTCFFASGEQFTVFFCRGGAEGMYGAGGMLCGTWAVWGSAPCWWLPYAATDMHGFACSPDPCRHQHAAADAAGGAPAHRAGKGAVGLRRAAAPSPVAATSARTASGTLLPPRACSHQRKGLKRASCSDPLLCRGAPLHTFPPCWRWRRRSRPAARCSTASTHVSSTPCACCRCGRGAQPQRQQPSARNGWRQPARPAPHPCCRSPGDAPPRARYRPSSAPKYFTSSFFRFV